MGWGNIYKRRVKVFAVALIIYFDYKALQQREKWANKSKKASLWEKAHERNARRVLNLIVELEGLWVKLGQYLSTRADVLPEAYICLLKQLQDSLPPRSLKEVCQTIEKELGKTMDDLFLDFDKVPLATASIAQVHRATLSDGQEVVVKVQHDGIKEVILEDLKNAKSIVDWIAWAEPQYNFHPMIDEWCKESPKELDFNHEAENTRKVSRNLCCNKTCDDSKPANHVDVLIPEVIQSTEKVLILEYMDGVRLNDAESLRALGVDKQKLVEEITRAYGHQIYVDGFFNGDPHPGNFLVSKEPPHRPILLDFGLTKLLSSSLKQALAKMFLAAAEGDHVALLAAFAEMGLKFRLDVPEQAMEVTSMFFRSSTPANEALASMKMLSEQRSKNFKVIQEKMKLNEKEVKRFNPVDAFPSDIVIFGRVLNLLRGLSATMNVRIVYIDIMRPFAESVLQCNLNVGPSLNPRWIYDTPIHSDVEAKLRQLLVELGNAEKILGIQVCAYKDGEVIIDTAAGVLGKYDPRPVQPDSLFTVFSATKGICAGLVHWLVDNGKLKLEDNIANIWPEFGSNGKDQIKVHHVLNHTSGLHNAMSDVYQEDPFLMTDWDQCLKRIAMSAPETAPGREQLYHYLSFGWLCGGIIEKASGKRFQELLEEVFVRPLKIDGELYVGIPPGVESRLATLTIDMSDLTKLSNVGNRSDLPTTFQPQQIAQLATTLPAICNSLYARRAIIPAANGHCSARALARYYAALAEGGKVPPPHHSSMSILGCHPHIPKFPSLKTVKKQKSRKKTGLDDNGQNSNSSTQNNYGRDGKGSVYIQIPSNSSCSIDDTSSDNWNIKLFHNPRVHDAFMGVGEYENLTYPDGMFGLGFKRSCSTNGELIGFGHSGMGGSTGFCNIKHKFAMAVTLNKMSFGTVTAKIIHLICSELNIPVPEEISRLVETGSTSQPEIALRAQFIIECLNDLKRNLVKRGLDLLVQHGKPEEIIPSLAKAYKAHTVYAHKETCSEEVKVEKLVTRNLQKLVSTSSGGLGNEPGTINTTKLELVWGSTMYHIEDLPFDCESLPDVYTQFRKSVESKSKIRNCTRLPTSFGPPPEVGDWGQVPQVTELGLQLEKVSKGVKFIGGESAALGRVHDYFWKKDLLKVYKETRNGMLGPDYSTKFSPWLASGSLSPRFIYEEVKRYEKERQSNDSTYWVLFELIWRDYFRFLSIKLGNLLFQAGGPQKVNINWSQDQTMFDAWRRGQTGYPLIDANMKELATTGFMSNRGRQIVCSFLVRDMGIDWRMGAEWFETCLLDYDPCSNYGNWTYGAGVGNDPREDRYFSIPKQAQNYDPEGEFVAYWLPELKALPREKRHSPGMMYLNPIVALKHGYTKKTGDSKKAFSSRRGRPDDNRRKWQGDGRKY